MNLKLLIILVVTVVFAASAFAEGNLKKKHGLICNVARVDSKISIFKAESRLNYTSTQFQFQFRHKLQRI